MCNVYIVLISTFLEFEKVRDAELVSASICDKF